MAGEVNKEERAASNQQPGLKELWLKEDWWAVWIGLAIVLIACALFAGGSSIGWVAVSPAKWSNFSQLGADFGHNWIRYIVQCGLFLAIFTAAGMVLGHRARAFAPAFLFVYLLSVVIFAVGAWDQANRHNLEPPLLALAVGLIISNLTGFPRWLDAGFRVEFYVKTGIVLLGAGLPFTMILWAGPVAILQASIVSVVTFLVIFFTGRKLGLERQLCATLGAGGAVCGVSAAIAIAGSVRAKKEHPPLDITFVRSLGDNIRVSAAFGGAVASFARRRRRSVDRNFRIRGCRRVRGRAIVWRPRDFTRWNYRNARSGGLVLHTNQSRWEGCVDWGVGVRDVAYFHHHVGKI